MQPTQSFSMCSVLKLKNQILIRTSNDYIEIINMNSSKQKHASTMAITATTAITATIAITAITAITR